MAGSSKVRGYGTAAIIGLLGLVACADADAPGGPGFLTEGALYGAGLGAAAGCATVVFDDDRDLEDCLGRAAVGGALGAAAGAATGYVVRDRQGRHAVDEARLEERLRNAEADLEAARRASDAARRAAHEHEAELARLEDEVASGEASQTELERAVRAAREDARRIARTRDELQRAVVQLDVEVAELRERDVGVPPELVELREELREELARLDEQLAVLSGAADAADLAG